MTPTDAVPLRGTITHLGWLLDTSGSMDQFKLQAMVAAQQRYLQTAARTLDGELYVTVGDFGGIDALGGDASLALRTYNVHRPYPIHQLPALVPHTVGGTPLVETLTKMLDQLEQYENRAGNTGFLVVVLTDGMDNTAYHAKNYLANNPEATREQVREAMGTILGLHRWSEVERLAARITEKSATGLWTFAYFTFFPYPALDWLYRFAFADNQKIHVANVDDVGRVNEQALGRYFKARNEGLQSMEDYLSGLQEGGGR